MNDMFRILLMLLFLERAVLQEAPPMCTCCSFYNQCYLLLFIAICPEAYVIRRSNSVCYKLVRSKSHYYFANNECKKDGGMLAQIENNAEDDYIK